MLVVVVLFLHLVLAQTGLYSHLGLDSWRAWQLKQFWRASLKIVQSYFHFSAQQTNENLLNSPKPLLLKHQKPYRMKMISEYFKMVLFDFDMYEYMYWIIYLVHRNPHIWYLRSEIKSTARFNILLLEVKLWHAVDIKAHYIEHILSMNI